MTALQPPHLHPYPTTPTPPSVSPDSDNPPPSASSSKLPKKDAAGAIGKWIKDKDGPVKNACLSCRTKKAKCDGAQPVCGQCSKKSVECVYVKSRRGGARKKREVPPPSALQEFLKRLDNLLALPDYSASVSTGTWDANEDTTNVVREFTSRAEVFRCYYNEVHPFLPVMPPRKYLDEILPILLPESPFLLAAQTIMSLVPHPRDPNPRSANSKRLRSARSNAFARQTMDVVQRLLQTRSSLESVQALVILSMWEWGQSGDVTRNRARSGQAIQVAMEMGLHEMDKYEPAGRAVEGEDWRKDMARRTWWIVFTSQITAALISGSTPVVGPDDPRIKVHYPVCNVSDSAWPNWINAMKHCSRIFGLINTVYYSEFAQVAAWGSRAEDVPEGEQEAMQRKLVMIDREVVELMKQAEETAIIDLVPGGEEEVVRNQQLSAQLGLATVHIHIHRNQAFPEVSLFSRRICGLPRAPDFSAMANSSDESPMAITPDLATPPLTANQSSSTIVTASGRSSGYDFIDELWQPEAYPDGLPTPWFSQPGGAASLYYPLSAEPTHIQPSATIQPINTPPPGSERRGSLASSHSHSQQKAHRAWGVDEKDQAVKPPEAKTDTLTVFPPGISLARCATAAHTIVRLEVLHRSAVIAMWDGPPKWMPFCACGLVTGAYAFLLLALAVQAENMFGDRQRSEARADEVEALLTNVKVILAGLEAYGVMWDGIDVMAGEVRAALEAATRLPAEVRAQIETSPAIDGPDDYDEVNEQDVGGYEFPSKGNTFVDGNEYPSNGSEFISGNEYPSNGGEFIDGNEYPSNGGEYVNGNEFPSTGKYLSNSIEVPPNSNGSTQPAVLEMRHSNPSVSLAAWQRGYEVPRSEDPLPDLSQVSLSNTAYGGGQGGNGDPSATPASAYPSNGGSAPYLSNGFGGYGATGYEPGQGHGQGAKNGFYGH